MTRACRLEKVYCEQNKRKQPSFSGEVSASLTKAMREGKLRRRGKPRRQQMNVLVDKKKSHTLET